MTWRLSAVAVRSWQRLMGVPGGEDFATAEQRLAEAIELVRQRYARDAMLRAEERLGRPGLYVYRGGRPLRVRVLVDAEAGEVVDVLAIDGPRSAVDSHRRVLAGWEESRPATPQNPPGQQTARPLEDGLTAKQRRALRRATKWSSDK